MDSSKPQRSRFEAVLQRYRSQLSTTISQPSALAARLSLPRAKPASKGSSTTASPEPDKDLKRWRDYCQSLAAELAKVQKQHRELEEARERDKAEIERLMREVDGERTRGEKTEQLLDEGQKGPLKDLAMSVIGLRTQLDRVQDGVRKQRRDKQREFLSARYGRAKSSGQNTKSPNC